MAPFPPSDLDRVLALFKETASEAASIALAYFRPGSRTSATITYKDGGSPVTEADFAVDRFLREVLCGAIADVAWLSEETADNVGRLGARHVLVVDPIDGTRGFLSGDARWTISIALVEAGRPVVGVVHAPVLDQCFSAVLGGGAFCNDVAIRTSTQSRLDEAVIAGPGDLSRHLSGPMPFRITPKIPSLACRFAHVAAGFLDGCVAAPDSHDWDIAAADLILHEAGGLLTDRHGNPVPYNRPKPTHPVLIGAPPQIHRALVDLMRRPGD